MVIGLMGGVGSGKSTVANILKEEYNGYLLLTDDIARELCKKGKACYEPIIKFFGLGIVDADGEIDRKKLAAIVFSDKEKLNKLNSITHPMVKLQVKEQIKRIYEQEKNPLIIIETALLITAGYKELCDQVWYISVDANIRQERLQSSRGYSKEKTEAILNNQMSELEYSDNSDVILYNNKGKDFLREQIKQII